MARTGGHTWQKNFREIPKPVLASLSRITEELVVVAATKVISVSEIDGGTYRHIGLRRVSDECMADTPTLPPAWIGRFSNRNLNGWEIIRKDLPMISKSFIWETPNFGDASTYGTHMHFQERDVYQRSYFEPRRLEISIEILNQREGASSVLVKFSLNHLLDRSHTDFLDDLFFCVNLLQENTGVCGVFANSATREDFISTISLDWEVFPPGTAAQVIAAFAKGGKSSKARAAVLEDRVKMFAGLKPRAYLRGTGSFGSYVGALYDDDLVVFENLTYGNALYVLYDEWAEVSKRSRLDLLKGTTKNFDRFLHTEGWKDRFTEHMKIELARH